MKDLPIGLETFSTLIENDYVYIDKTKYIYKMARPGKRIFLSRPRRFGKSLLVSTIEELYRGNKKLFEGLFIYNKWDWNKTHPVIVIDFGDVNVKTKESLTRTLSFKLDKIAKRYDIKLTALI
ncbi:AAA family ATPase [Methanobrevibacter curvatus]|uniref:Putative AAA-ATPase n=1 Tax=Methanobrevibacter curvatus TaxID=49547 RepID=A0A162FMK9_9EURY|nr:AAA family ATPase [Methanobrevibacter curvatus]KZX12260.1 putative AAA-ATPase [Methanobrevibacter curvatus]